MTDVHASALVLGAESPNARDEGGWLTKVRPRPGRALLQYATRLGGFDQVFPQELP